jgi:hypothetical protein
MGITKTRKYENTKEKDPQELIAGAGILGCEVGTLFIWHVVNVPPQGSLFEDRPAAFVVKA